MKQQRHSIWLKRLMGECRSSVDGSVHDFGTRASFAIQQEDT
jgi:hypothetical protein